MRSSPMSSSASPHIRHRPNPRITANDLSRSPANGRWIGLSFVVEVGDSVRDSAFESVGIGEGTIGQIMLLEVAPASFDIVQFGGVFRQPLDGEPGALGKRAG